MNNSASTIQLYALPFSRLSTYLLVALFVAGNIALPQLVHSIPQGGLIWLPIYFFTLIGAYKYGWKVGLLTAVASPVANSLLFGMPVLAMLPIILMKSSFLAVTAAYAAHRYGRISPAILAGVIIAYQFLGILCEWAYTGSLSASLTDVTIGIPGLLVQWLGGYLTLRFLLRNA